LKPIAWILAAGFVVLFVGGGARFAIGLTFKPMVDDLGWPRAAAWSRWCTRSAGGWRRGA
jgi:hypothetical protein